MNAVERGIECGADCAITSKFDIAYGGDVRVNGQCPAIECQFPYTPP